MDFEIRHDGTNVSDHVINYARNQQICSGVGTLDITLENINLNRTITPWDTIVLHEEGNKIGTYIVATTKKSADGGTIMLQCQDNSKRLIDHFVTDDFTIPYPTTTRYWIEYFLNDAGLDYEFTTDLTGEIVAPNSSFGMSSAYDMIVTFLQQSGWYIYFDKNGKAIIGNLQRAGDAYNDTINDNEILKVQRMRNDNRLRNRAVVWGMGDPLTGTWIGADISTITAWNYDSDDKRAVVFSNSMIYSTTVAEDLARKMLNEFSQIANEITVELIGHHDINIGDMVRISSDAFSGRMMVTTIESSGSEEGLILRLTLNQKCPRLFAYFGTLGDFIPVYIGTAGEGVWMKYTGGSIWTPINNGLVGDALYIKDMFVKMGNMVITTGDGYMYYANTQTYTWTKFEHQELIDLMINLYLEPDVKAEVCSIDDLGNLVVGYNYDDGTIKRAWVLTVSGTGTLLKAEQVIPQEGEDYTEDVKLIDLEAIGYPEEGIIDSVTSEGFNTSPSALGTKEFQSYLSIDPNCYGVGPLPGQTLQAGISGGGSALRAGYIIENDDILWFLTYSGGAYRLFQYDLPTFTKLNEYLIGPPTQGTILGNYDIPRSFIYKSGFTTFEIVSLNVLSGAGQGFTLYHYRYTLGDSNFVLINTESFSFPTLSGADPGVFKGALQNHIATWIVATDGPFKLTQTNLTFIVYNIISKDSYTAAAGSVDAEDTWENDYPGEALPFFVANGTAVYAGLIFWWRTDKSIGGSFREIRLRMVGGWVGAFGSTGSISADPIDLWTFVTDRDGVGIEDTMADPFLYGYENIGFDSRNFYGAANPSTVYLFGETAIKHYTYNQPFSDDEVISIVVSIPFPGYAPRVDTVSFTRGDGNNDPGLHLHLNNIYNGSISQTWFVSSRVYTPLYVRKIYTDSDFYLQFIDPMSLTDTKISMIDLGFSSALDNHPLINVGFYRDDYDGSVYSIIFPTGGGEGLGGLYAFDFSGVNTKFIEGWGNPAPNIVKTYAIAPSLIRKFGYPSSLGSTTKILKHTSTPFEGGLIGASLFAQEQTYGTFETILNANEKLKVEISKGVPTVVYSTPLISGGPLLPELVPFGRSVVPYMAASATNALDSFYELPNMTQWEFRDVRVFDTPSTLPLASGVLPESILERYVAMTTSGEVLLSRYDFPQEIYTLVTISGLMVLTSGMIPTPDPNSIINLIETTNYTLDPYFFIATSGTTPLFFQRTVVSGFNSGWVNRSYTLPTSGITIIRVDDML